jgi:glyoxylase-like metal-dependent hydrolase (beta-lactamase superfamily II)
MRDAPDRTLRTQLLAKSLDSIIFVVEESSMIGSREIDRRSFLGAAVSCGAHMMFVASGSAAALHQLRSPSRWQVASVEPWGRLERLADGIWALVSTPLEGDRTTLCNGGIIAGADGVLIVESFATPSGAAWMAERARELTGKWPSHVVLSHFHGDHTGGVVGYHGPEVPQVHATEVTRDLALETESSREVAPDTLKLQLLADVVILDPLRATDIDLGGRSVTVLPRRGHTPSDVTVELAEPSIVFCGDLVWNRMFPNYRDATPSLLSRDVRALERSEATVYVPGHGPLADNDDLARYLAVIDQVEVAAKRAFEDGVSASAAAQQFTLPPAVGEWLMFSPRYYEVALSAWLRELKGKVGGDKEVSRA